MSPCSFRRFNFVLASYHKSKYLWQNVRDMGEKSAPKYKELLFFALRDGDKERFAALSAEIPKASTKKVGEALNCLCNHFNAIHIRYANPEVLNGSATEAHISYVLSFHLSSRPVTWSEQTLKHLVSVLATGQFGLKKPIFPPAPKKAQRHSFFHRLPEPCSGHLSSCPFRQSDSPF